MPGLIRRISILLLAAATWCWAQPYGYTVIGDDQGSWPRILESIGLRSGDVPQVFVLRQGTPPRNVDWKSKVESGALLVLEGDSALARSFGIVPTGKKATIRSTVESANPKIPVVWEKSLEVEEVRAASPLQVLTRERWTQAPLVVGGRMGQGAVLWLAVPPGTRGYERFPYLLQALTALGLRTPFESRRLWAFFDSSYRLRVDLDYFAERWRKSGIAAVHVAAWQYEQSSPERDEYLRRLIEACHKRAIHVYAWVELPHVSEEFWQRHPEWREKTAAGQDAHLDWRKLMNLQNADCRNAVLSSLTSLIGRFDWDGVNLGELYFESLEGSQNPARFTPFNADIRDAFRSKFGREADIKDVDFLAFRADLVQEMQRYWLNALDGLRRQSKPYLDLVLTHVDDRYDTRMRNLIGADAARSLGLVEQKNMTFLIEDPATVWHLGPERYPEIANRYEPLTRNPERLAIDINVVERYQDVYPTKQQTGSELFQLVHLSSTAFARVALYFENSLLPVDLPLLPASAAHVQRYEQMGRQIAIEAPQGVRVRWSGGATVDGRAWPFVDGEWLQVPAGAHALASAEQRLLLRVVDLNANLLSGEATEDGVEFSYQSQGRALAVVSARPAKVEVDGENVVPTYFGTNVLVLPQGQHVVHLTALDTVSKAIKH